MAKTKKRERQKAQVLAGHIKRLFPACPQSKVNTIANYCIKNTSRLRYAETLTDEEKAEKAVFAYIRHVLTDYDDLISGTMTRADARTAVQPQIQEILERWGYGCLCRD